MTLTVRNYVLLDHAGESRKYPQGPSESLIFPSIAQVRPLVIDGHTRLLPLLLHVESDPLGTFEHSEQVLPC
jgi:hypothetical protein